MAPGAYHGYYTDPDTLESIGDESERYFVAVPRSEVGELRTMLSMAFEVFKQKCIYLSIAGKVEFVEADDEEE